MRAKTKFKPVYRLEFCFRLMKLLPQQSSLLILNEQTRIVVMTILIVRETISVLEVTVQNATVTNQIVTVTIQMVTTTILVCSFYFNKQLC